MLRKAPKDIQEMVREIQAGRRLVARLDESVRKQAEAKALGRFPWFRLHAAVVEAGIWRVLRPSSRSVYVALVSRCDNRSRATLIGLKKAAELSGYAPATVAEAYRELKDWGLIFRQRITHNGYRPYRTWICNPDKWQVPDRYLVLDP